MSTSGNPQGCQTDEGAHARISNDPVAQNTFTDPCETIRKQISSLNKFFTKRRLNSERIEAYLHDLWSFVIKTAMITPANGPAQKSVVAELVNARDRGSLSSNAMTADGNIWKDLPFLVMDVSKYYLDNWMGLKKEERLNLAAFTARLVKEDEKAYNLELCALLVFRETFETRREHGSDISVAELLPAAVAWFDIAGPALVEFVRDSPSNWAPGVMEARLSAVGELALEAGMISSFNSRRWNFWKRRLDHLSSIGDKEIKEQARKAKECMEDASKQI